MEEKLVQLQAKLEADASFGKKLFSLENPEEVQSLLKEQGLEFSQEEINSLRDMIIKALAKEDGELSDEELKEVAGGNEYGLLRVIEDMVDYTFNHFFEEFGDWISKW